MKDTVDNLMQKVDFAIVDAHAVLDFERGCGKVVVVVVA